MGDREICNVLLITISLLALDFCYFSAIFTTVSHVDFWSGQVPNMRESVMLAQLIRNSEGDKDILER